MPTKKSTATKSSKAPGDAAKTSRRKATKRERIDTGTDTRYVRRDTQGKFKESDDLGRSLAADRRRKSKKSVPAGQGDKGDQKRKSS